MTSSKFILTKGYTFQFIEDLVDTLIDDTKENYWDEPQFLMEASRWEMKTILRKAREVYNVWDEFSMDLHVLFKDQYDIWSTDGLFISGLYE